MPAERTAPDRVAIVTGTSAGIGAAVAQLLLDHGWEVVGLARRSTTVAHDRYHHLALDLNDLGGLESAMEQRIAPLLKQPKWERVGLVNNAATPDLLGPLQSIDGRKLAGVYAVNVVAPVWLMGFVSRITPADRPLRIVNVSSGAAIHPFPGLSAYGSGKAALRMAGQVLAEEWVSTVPHAPVRPEAAILSYEPGVVDTEMQAMARSLSPIEFPWVGTFQQFLADGRIVEPERPATEIVGFLEGPRRAPFTESRLD